MNRPSFALTFLPVALVGLCLAGCAADTEVDSASGAADIKASSESDSATVTPEKAAARVLALAPVGKYLGTSPDGKQCSVVVTSANATDTHVVVTHIDKTFDGDRSTIADFAVHPAVNTGRDIGSAGRPTAITKWTDKDGTLSFHVSWGMQNTGYASDVSLTDLQKSGATIKVVKTTPEWAGNWTAECGDLVAQTPVDP